MEIDKLLRLMADIHDLGQIDREGCLRQKNGN